MPHPPILVGGALCTTTINNTVCCCCTRQTDSSPTHKRLISSIETWKQIKNFAEDQSAKTTNKKQNKQRPRSAAVQQLAGGIERLAFSPTYYSCTRPIDSALLIHCLPSPSQCRPTQFPFHPSFRLRLPPHSLVSGFFNIHAWEELPPFCVRPTAVTATSIKMNTHS